MVLVMIQCDEHTFDHLGSYLQMTVNCVSTHVRLHAFANARYHISKFIFIDEMNYQFSMNSFCEVQHVDSGSCWVTYSIFVITAGTLDAYLGIYELNGMKNHMTALTSNELLVS